MNTTTEIFDGQSHVVRTESDDDAREQLMLLTGHFFNMLEHVARFHSRVITPEYGFDVFSDLEVIWAKFNLPEPSPV